jgi:SPP1 family predicted phage head-tail adaptor
MLPANELAELRAAILDLLPDTCDILSVSRAPDGHGGSTDTWTTASAAVKCRLDYRTGQEVVSGGAIQSYQAEVLTVPYNTVITTASRVSYGGALYNVLSVSEGSLIAVKRVSLEKL